MKVTLKSRHLRRKISAHVDGGLSRGSRVRRPGSEDPHRRELKFLFIKVIEFNVKKSCQLKSELPLIHYFQIAKPSPITRSKD